jgi:F-type H+-transporting ATPase subunit alpha
MSPPETLKDAAKGVSDVFEATLRKNVFPFQPVEIGYVDFIGRDIARVNGLPGVEADELLQFPGEVYGTAFDLTADEIGVMMLGDSGAVSAGDEVLRTRRLIEVPVGDGLLGRVVDPLGRALDRKGTIRAAAMRRIEQPAPGIMDREPVTVPLQTGIKAIDAMIPVGRGQRELILGDRQTGKTAVALDTIINQKDTGVISVYCAIGQRGSAVAKFIASLESRGVLGNCVIVVASGEDAPGLQFAAPYAATSMAEYFMRAGRDVLIVYDDLIRHAQAYRQVSLLFRRPPAREAYPGDIFYIHSRLLERATHLKKELGGGSLTALPVIETEAQNIAAYIPTNLISITDGQIYLSPSLFEKGILPAIDVGRSVSRVGGKAQLSAYRAVAGDLHLSYSQFEELEAFSRFGTRLDENTRRTIEHGRRVREVLKQPQFSPLPVPEQVAVLLAVSRGLFDDIPLERIADAEKAVRHAVITRLADTANVVAAGKKLTDEDERKILGVAREAIQ